VPHVVRRGRIDLEAAWRGLPRGPWRWGTAVAKVEGCFLASNGEALLVAGIVVEFGRPLHPVLIVSFREGDTAVHLWSHAPVERTDTVKRLLARVADNLTAFGAGEVVTTNIAALLS
jgi:hypothetical protein